MGGWGDCVPIRYIMGRPRKSDEEKRKRGETRPSRVSGNGVNKGSFQVLTEMPDPPSRFGEVAQEEWKSRVRDLWESGHRTAAFVPLLERWCENVELAEQAYQQVKHHGMVYENSRGNLNKNPWWTSYQEACATLNTLSKKLGFSPYDQGLIKPVEQEGEQKKEDDLIR